MIDTKYTFLRKEGRIVVYRGTKKDAEGNLGHDEAVAFGGLMVKMPEWVRIGQLFYHNEQRIYAPPRFEGGMKFVQYVREGWPLNSLEELNALYDQRFKGTASRKTA